MPCLDTTVLIDLRRARGAGERAEAALRRLVRAGERLTTTRINEAEFRVGIYLSRDAAEEQNRVERVLAPLEILDFSATSADQYAILKARQMSIGRPVGDVDLLIAAIVLSADQTLLTRNPRHFAEIPGLVVESY